MPHTRMSGWLLVGIAFLFAFSMPDAGLVGKWKGSDGGDEIGFIVFDKDGFVTIELQGGAMGGPKFNAGGADASMRYEVNTAVEPHQIDFVIRLLEDDSELGRLPGIYKLVNPKTLLLNMNFDGPERPVEFDPEDPNQIQLIRIRK